MTCPTTWHVLNALSGTTLDIGEKTLFVSPRIGNSLTELHMPVFFSKFWLWLDYVPSKNELKLRTIKTFGSPVTIEKVAPEGEAQPVKLAKPFLVKEGSVLDLSSYMSKLILYPKPKTVDYEVKASFPYRPGLSSEDLDRHFRTRR